MIRATPDDRKGQAGSEIGRILRVTIFRYETITEGWHRGETRGSAWNSWCGIGKSRLGGIDLALGHWAFGLRRLRGKRDGLR